MYDVAVATPAARVQDVLFRDVLGDGAHAIERAVIDRRTTGEKDIAVVVERLANLFETTKRDTYSVLGITSSKVSRRSEMNVDVLDRAGAALKLYARVSAMIGENGATVWFKQPNPHLAGKRPLDLLASSLGRQRLASMVTSLEDGAFL
jgi:uncharacterized protein (DUF2384 family)